MPLWTEVIEPNRLTDYIRLSFQEYEKRKGTLAAWLPNRNVRSITHKFYAGQAGLVEEALFHAFDTPPSVHDREHKREITLSLPKVGGSTEITEIEQLRLRDGADDELEQAILEAADRLAAGISDRMEYLRGIVLASGKATIGEMAVADDYGRDATHNITDAQSWATSSVSRLTGLQTWSDLYEANNGSSVGAIVMNRATFRKFAAGDEMKTQLLNGASRLPTDTEVNSIVAGQGLAPIHVYNRRTKSGMVLADNTVLLLPTPVESDDYMGTELGATFWGQTLESSESAWGIASEDRPGIVSAVFRNDAPPLAIHAYAEAIGLPVLANANLSMKVTV